MLRPQPEHFIFLLINFSKQSPCSPCSAIIVIEGEAGLHWNNNKSVPLNTLNNSRALAFTKLPETGLEFAESSLFLIGLEHAIVKAQELEKEEERERKTLLCITSTLAQH